MTYLKIVVFISIRMTYLNRYAFNKLRNHIFKIKSKTKNLYKKKNNLKYKLNLAKSDITLK